MASPADGPAKGRNTRADDPVGTNLTYGAEIDLAAMDITKPAGEAADWDVLFGTVQDMDLQTVAKITYHLTVRGREAKKSHSGSRIKYKNRANDKDEHIYISFGTSESSIMSHEMTVGRWLCVASRFLMTVIMSTVLNKATDIRLQPSPLMDVIGFSALLKQWGKLWEFHKQRFQKLEYQNEEGKAVDDSTKEEGSCAWEMFKAGEKNPAYMALLHYKGKEYFGQYDMLQKWYRAAEFGSPQFLAAFALGADRCPPHIAIEPGAVETGLVLAIFQDLRNRVRASVLIGTAQEKGKVKSEFAKSYLRRTSQFGGTVQPLVLNKIWDRVSPVLADNMQIGADLDPELRNKINELIKKKVSAMSSNTPELF